MKSPEDKSRLGSSRNDVLDSKLSGIVKKAMAKGKGCTNGNTVTEQFPELTDKRKL
jgi:hypothetical protein